MANSEMTGAALSTAADAAVEHAAYLGRQRFSSLDGLRFFCIFAVLWHHSPAFSALDNPPVLLTRGFLGVDFFFVLSGFLITTLLLREAATQGRFSLKGFYWRRLLRIVPVYFFLVTVVSAWFILGKGQTQYAPLVPVYYLFLVNFLTTSIPLLYPLWSLSVEEQYYLIWPLLLRVLPRLAVLPVLGLLIALNVIGIMGLTGLHGPEIGPLHIALPNATYAPILIGSALAVVLENRQGFAVLLRLFGGRLAPLWTAALVLALAGLGPDDLRGLPNLAIHLAMAACLASLVVRDDTIVRPLMIWRPIARVGVISYGLYLYHLAGLHVATIVAARLPSGLDTPWLVTPVYVAASILIAEISFRTLETWFRRFRHKPARRVPAERHGV